MARAVQPAVILSALLLCASAHLRFGKGELGLEAARSREKADNLVALGPEQESPWTARGVQLEPTDAEAAFSPHNWIEPSAVINKAGSQFYKVSRGRLIPVVGVLILLLIALSPVAMQYGAKPFLATLLYITSICCIKVSVKFMFNQHFGFPYTVTALHMLITAVVASAIERPHMRDARGTLAISVLKAVSLGLSNAALLFGTAAFASIIGSLTPVTTFLVDVIRTRSMETVRALAILTACIGAILCTKGELSFSLPTLLLALGGCMTRSFKTVWSHDLLMQDVSVYRLAGWSAIWSFLIMMVVSGCVEGGAPYRQVRHLSMAGVLHLLVSCVAAVLLNILQCYCLVFLGPVLQTVFGSLELVTVIMFAGLLLHETVTKLEWVGVTMICLGCSAVKARDAYRALWQQHVKQDKSSVWETEGSPSVGKNKKHGL